MLRILDVKSREPADTIQLVAFEDRPREEGFEGEVTITICAEIMASQWHIKLSSMLTSLPL